MSSRAFGLRARVGLVLGGALVLAAALVTAWWVGETRRAIGEEVEAASRVAEQWLNVLVAETLRDRADGPRRLMAHLHAVGRLRANQLEVVGPQGEPLYISPEPTYKAGRFAPAWFAGLVSPALPLRRFDAGDRQLVLRPDTSRAALDAWDDLVSGLGWAGAVLLLVTFTSRVALNRALAPLGQIDAALARGAEGHFDRRLPSYRVAELDRLAASYNRLAERLDDSEARNVRLEQDQAFANALRERLTEERRLIARELHDELGQGIAAVRALSGAILQRCDDAPHINGPAQAILGMTGQLQDGVRTILQRLRPAGAGSDGRLDVAVADYCRQWSVHHPQIRIDCDAARPDVAPSEAESVAVLRLLQESLTNVARHSQASVVEVRLRFGGDAIALDVRDNGRGLAQEAGRGGFGLAGMRERVAELHGELQLDTSPGGGLRVRVRLPQTRSSKESSDGLYA